MSRWNEYCAQASHTCWLILGLRDFLEVLGRICEAHPRYLWKGCKCGLPCLVGASFTSIIGSDCLIEYCDNPYHQAHGGYE